MLAPGDRPEMTSDQQPEEAEESVTNDASVSSRMRDAAVPGERKIGSRRCDHTASSKRSSTSIVAVDDRQQRAAQFDE